MKKLFLLLAFITNLSCFCQVSSKTQLLKTQLTEIENERIRLSNENRLKTEKAYQSNPNTAPAVTAQYLSEFQKEEGALASKAQNIRAELQSMESYQNAETSNNRTIVQNQQQKQSIENLRVQQSQAIEGYNVAMNRTVNSLNSAGNALMMVQMRRDQEELKRRQKVANSFIRLHNDKLENISTIYNQIPPERFATQLNGKYNAYLINKKRYSFLDDSQFMTQEPCIVDIRDNVITNVYLNGKEKMQLGFSNLPVQYGVANYSDYDTLESSTILVLEPFIKPLSTPAKTIANQVSYLTLWSSDKKDEGKIVYVQELDSKGNIFREIHAPILYAKNKKELTSDSPRIAINSGNGLLYFGEKTSTPYGEIALYPKISKRDFEKLTDNEHRFVEIKKYRE